MSTAFTTLCQSKIPYPVQQILPTYSNRLQNSNSSSPDGLSAYSISVLAALGELTLGLPLDRIKIGLQSGLSFHEILKPNSAPKTHGTTFRSPGYVSPRNLLAAIRTSMGYWFAGHTPSIINRCFIYLPGIAYLNTGYTQKIEPWLCFAGGCPRLTSQAFVKPILVSALISPYVSLFEGLKLTQQLGYQKVYPPEINKFINIGIRTGQETINNYPSIAAQTPTTYQLIRGVLNSGYGGILFASFWPTFARETLFISGMCVVQPQITNWFQTVEISTSGQIFSSETARVLGSLVASFACQTISQPFDVLKTRSECMPATSWAQHINQINTDIKNKGARLVLFSGWLPRCVRGVWTFYSVSAIRDWLTERYRQH